MNEYEVTFDTYATYTTTIKANSREEAIKKAHAMLNDPSFYSSYLDSEFRKGCEFWEATVYEDGVEEA